MIYYYLKIWMVLLCVTMTQSAHGHHSSPSSDLHDSESLRLRKHKFHKVLTEESVQTDNDHEQEVSHQIENMFRNHYYELSIRPGQGDKITNVGISVIIESITDISEKNMELTFTLCMHEKWVDSRLKFSPSVGSNQSIVLPSRFVEKIWVPDIYIIGSKRSFIHHTAVDNRVLRLFDDGTIMHTLKITTTVACQMNLYNFPLDTEFCYLVFQSLGYYGNEVNLFWLSEEEQFEDLFMDLKMVQNMPKFQLVHYSFHSRNISKKSMFRFPVKQKSQLEISFEMKRYPLSVFFQAYFPAMAMVLLAGMGMWIDPRSVPARIALGVTTVLTISTVITGLKSSLPKVSYLTAMDIYLWACFLFVFSTVIEYCLVNFFITKKEELNNGNITRNTFTVVDWDKWQERIYVPKDATNIDVCYRIGYFIGFLVFNLVYWIHYIVVTKHSNESHRL